MFLVIALLPRMFLYIGVLAVAACIVLLLWLVPRQQTNRLRGVTAKERFELENAARTTLAQIIGGVFVLLGVFATWYTVWISQGTLGISENNLKVAQETMKVTQQAQFTERFTKAINQLGDKQLDVRLGGIYALERLAKESTEDRAAIIEVLTAFVRTHAPITRQTGHLDCESSTSFIPILNNGKLTGLRAVDHMPQTVWPPRDVQTILEILGKGEITGQFVLGLSNTDLECAYLARYHLERVAMQHTHLENAWLKDAHLDEAILQGVVATNTVFQGVTFRNADVSGAHLEHAVNIDCDKLAEADNFMGAYLPRGCKAALANKMQQEKAFLESEVEIPKE
jgi:Pentapeptide repeats (8 copies)